MIRIGTWEGGRERDIRGGTGRKGRQERIGGMGGGMEGRRKEGRKGRGRGRDGSRGVGKGGQGKYPS